MEAGRRLPLRTLAGAVRVSPRNTQPRCRELHVLLVEDNPGDVRLIREAFEESRVDSSLTVRTDGEAALDYLFQRDGGEEGPDLVLLDLNVPKLDGKAVLDAITDDAALRTIPVIVLSGSKAPDDIRETYRSGADGYFTKPTDPNEFISTVRTVGESLADGDAVPEGAYADVDMDA